MSSDENMITGGIGNKNKIPLQPKKHKMQFVAYGLDMVGYLVIEVEEFTIIHGHNKALKILEDNNIDYDTLETFNKQFMERMNWN